MKATDEGDDAHTPTPTETRTILQCHNVAAKMLVKMKKTICSALVEVVEIASMLLRDLLCGVEECCALSVEWFSSEYWRDRKGVYCHTAYDMP